MGYIQITDAPLSLVPSANQTVTISYRLWSAPDVSGSYTVASNAVAVQPNGHLVTPYYITGLADATSYVVKIVNNCGGAGWQTQFNTPAAPTTTVPVTTTVAPTTTLAPCPDIVSITGTASYGTP